MTDESEKSEDESDTGSIQLSLQRRRAVVHARASVHIQSSDLGTGRAALWRTHMPHGTFIWLFSHSTGSRLVVYCQIISHCLCLLNGRPSSCGEWPLSAARSPARAGVSLGVWTVPSVSGLEAQKWMDSISGPITFSLAHVRRNLQPCPGQASVRGQGSHTVHISMQVEAAWHWIMFLPGGSHYFEAKHTSPPHDLHLHFALLEDNEWHYVMKRMWPHGR